MRTASQQNCFAQGSFHLRIAPLKAKQALLLKSRRDDPQDRRPLLEAVRLLLKGTEFPIAY